jgi:hypothetical protein
MKKTTRILTVLALAASSVLFATPSHATTSDRWVAATSPTTFVTADITGLVVGTTVAFKSVSTPNNLNSPFPSNLTVTAISTTGHPFGAFPDISTQNYCNYYTCGTQFSSSTVVYKVTVSASTFNFWTLAEFTFNAASGSTGPTTRVRGNVKATVDSVTFTDDGTGTGGSLSWKGTNIDSVLYMGPEANYPKAFNYGAYTSSWNGALRDLTPNTTYTFDFYVNSIDDYPAMKSVTFKTGAAPVVAVTKDAAYWTKFVDTFVIYSSEAANIKKLMSKFNAIQTSPYRSSIKVPTSRITTVTASSLTPTSCSVAKNGVVRGLSGETCTISYTVTGASKAPVTLVRDFTFTNFVGQ